MPYLAVKNLKNVLYKNIRKNMPVIQRFAMLESTGFLVLVSEETRQN